MGLSDAFVLWWIWRADPLLPAAAAAAGTAGQSLLIYTYQLYHEVRTWWYVIYLTDYIDNVTLLNFWRRFRKLLYMIIR